MLREQTMTEQHGWLGDHKVRRIGYGAMQLAEGTPPPRDDAIAVLRRAVELGVDHIDTAEFYGHGLANDLIRAALWPYPDDLALVSKVGAVREGRLVAAQRPEQLRAGVEANLRGLGVERLAAVNLRRLDAPPGIVAAGDQKVDIDSQLAELVALRDEGKIDGIGLSGVGLDELRRALPVGVVCVQTSTTSSTAPPSRSSRSAPRTASPGCRSSRSGRRSPGRRGSPSTPR